MSTSGDSPNPWSRVETLFHETLAQPAEERQRFLAVACEGDEELRREVASLLEALADEDMFREGAAAELALHLSHEDVEVGRHETAGTVLESTGASSAVMGRSHPRRLGPYTLLRVLGEGGMGTVYLAEQSAPLPRRVALKLMRWGGASGEALRRFELERKAMARLNHPAIAQVFGAGASEHGQPYVAIEYIPGLHITRYCDTQRFDLRRRIELLIAVCEGMQHAHERGVIHRDLKPSNILVAEIGGKPLPKIIDFGIVKAAAPWIQTEAYTASRVGLGSPGYISPEAAHPSDQSVDARTDVYSLGVVLSQLIAGVRPFDPGQILQHRGTGTLDPQSPSQGLLALPAEKRREIASQRHLEEGELVKQLRQGLDWIVIRAVAYEPSERYASVADLAADLERWLAKYPIDARPPRFASRVHKVLRRQALAAGFILAVLVGFGLRSCLPSDRFRPVLETTDAAVGTREPAITPPDPADGPADRAQATPGHPSSPPPPAQLHPLQFEVPYFFDDLVDFDSIDGKGRGTITTIFLEKDKAPCYEIYLKDEDSFQSGVYAEEIELVSRSKASWEELRASADRNYEFFPLPDGSVHVRAKTLYTFGDVRPFHSAFGRGQGAVTAIVIPKLGPIDYEMALLGKFSQP